MFTPPVHLIPRLMIWREGTQCRHNEYLNNKTKECSECPAGSFGLNCKQRCPSGYYGRLCKSVCECPHSDCNHVAGCTNTENSSDWFRITPDVKHQTAVSEYTNNHSHLQNKISAIENTKTVSKWMNKTTVLQTKLTSSLYPARLQDLYVKHDTDTWIAVSCSLIGSFVILILIGCLLYFQSRSKLRIKHPKRIGRILSSSTGAGRNLDLLEGHFELSILTPEHQYQDDDTYAEIRLSQIDGACAASCMGTISENEKYKVSKQPNHAKRNTNLYEKCSFETEYDQINLKMKSSFSPLLHKEQKDGCDKDHESDVLSSKKEFVIHGESCTSLTLPSSLKRFRMRENNQPKTHLYSLHHAVSEQEFNNEQEKNDIEENHAELNQAKYITLSGPNMEKEEDRPYSVVHLSSYKNLNSKERVKPGIGFHSNAKPEENVLKPELNQAEHIAASDPNVKEDDDRPYSVVHLSSYNDLNSKESVKPGTGFPSNAKPEEKIVKPEIGEVKHMTTSDPYEKEEDRPYSVVHLSLYDDGNSKDREKPGKMFSSNSKREEKEISKQKVPE